MKCAQLSVEGFMDELASDSPAPGGGSAAALAGAAAAALCAMVARITGSSAKHRDAWAEMAAVQQEADGIRARLVCLVDEDARAFNAVMEALKLPRGTEEEKASRRSAVSAASLAAARVPRETLAAMSPLAHLAATAVARGSSGCLTDAGSAAALVGAAARAAAYNVRANLPSIADPTMRASMANETDASLASVLETVDGICRIVESMVKERIGS